MVTQESLSRRGSRTHCYPRDGYEPAPAASCKHCVTRINIEGGISSADLSSKFVTDHNRFLVFCLGHCRLNF